MKAIFALFVLSLASCNDPLGDNLPSIPPNRPPSLGEMTETEIELLSTYEAAPAPWNVWTGQANVFLAAPDVGQAASLAEVSVGSGFTLLAENCIGDEGTWTYDESTGDLFIETEGLSFELVATYSFERVRISNAYEIVSTLTLVGTWTGVSCGEGSFAGGTTGPVTGVELELSVMAVPNEEGPTNAALIYDATSGELVGVVTS